MADNEKLDKSKYNSIYYNQMLRANDKQSAKRARKIRKESFSSKKVDFSRYLPVPSGYEGLVYTLYFLTIPYIVGATFLFFYVASATFDNFVLLEFSSFLIVWMIGYEITGAVILFFIFIAFLKHLKRDS